MEALLAFAAALLSLRLAGGLAGRWRERRAPALAALGLRAARLRARIRCARLGRGARLGRALVPRLLPLRRLADGAAARRRFAALIGRRWAGPAAFLWSGLAIGVMIAVPVHGSFAGTGIPTAQAHLDFLPARLLAVLGNSVGTIAVVVVALLGIRRRPLGNALILAGVVVAAIGSALGRPRRGRNGRVHRSRCAAPVPRLRRAGPLGGPARSVRGLC